MSGPIFVISSMLVLLFLVMHLVGRQAAVPPEVSDTALRRDQVRQLLSGEYHREPLKNPDLGPGRLRCLVRDASGQGASGARLRITPIPPAASVLVPPAPHPHFWEVSADARGQAAIAGLPAGAFLVLATRAGDHAVARVDVGEGSGIAEAILVLSPNAPRAGTVKDRAGAPVAGATVTPLSARDWAGVAEPYRALQAGTDENGAFTLPHLPPGEWNLFVAAPGLAPRAVRAEGAEPITAVLDTGETIFAQLLREGDGRPLGNVKVALRATDPPGETYTVQTSGSGHFTVDHVRPATYALSLISDTYTASASLTVAPGQRAGLVPATPESRNMRIDPLTGTAVATPASGRAPSDSAARETAPAPTPVLAYPAGAIRGRVLDSTQGAGVPGVRVLARGGDAAGAPREAVTDQGGYYHIRGLVPGTYTIWTERWPDQIFALGSSAVAEANVDGSGTVTGPVFEAAPAVYVSGEVLDDAGNPVADPNIVVEVAGAPDGPYVHAADAGGRFHIGGLHPDDQIRIVARKLSASSSAFGPVSVGPSGLQAVLLRMGAAPWR
ncbi:MAG: carboxypeptidase regulatory-like domain-containing protein [Candidatus Hydrogenedentes bacterium]|nr:carboxypeptidase regulatory-like domain-containing protein [Candidatus Hydrogenedentota bacterium]